MMKNFTGEAIDSLEAELREAGFLNAESPLYDLSDNRVLASYQKLQKTTKPEAYPRDTSSWQEIWHCVSEHVSKYGDGALVMIAGAAPHIWGAIPELKKSVGARYVSSSSVKLNMDLAIKQLEEDAPVTVSGKSREEKEKLALGTLEVQMERALGVVKKLGYYLVEDYLADMSRAENPMNLIVGLEETGEHSLYNSAAEKPIYKLLEKFIAEQKPTSVLFIGEDLDVGGKGGDGKELLQYAKSQEIPVGIGAFGHADRIANEPHQPFQVDRFTASHGVDFVYFGSHDDNRLSKWFTPEVMTRLQLEIEKHKSSQ